MKPKFRHLRSLAIASSALLSISYAHAQSTLYWDANAATALRTDGAGVWLAANQWWTGSANTNWVSGSNAVFGYSGAGGAVTLAGTTTVNSFVFNPFTGTYTIGTAGVGNTITLNNGITKNANGTVTIASPLSLGGAQTWMNNAAGSLNINDAVTLNGNLTIGGIGNVVMNSASAIIGGTGNLIKNGPGNISHGGNTPAHNFTGNLIINGGSISSQSNAWLTGRNTSLTNGYIGGRFGSGFTWTSGLGTGANQIQITGISGFSGEGGSNSAFQIGGALSTLKWGASTENGATGFFNPTALLLNGNANMNPNGLGSLNNAIDLNGTSREFTSLHANWSGGNNTSFTINGAIVNTAGTAAGLIRTGAGNLSLIAANTYNGATTLNGGTLTLRTSGTIANTSALNLGGGTLRMVNTANTQRFADVAVSATAGGGITYENTAGAVNYTESLGTLTLTKGQVNVLLLNDHNAAAGSQTLTFGTAGTSNLIQGVSGRGSITFSAPTTGLNATKNRVAVFGATASGAGNIVGPWATIGTAANIQTEFAAYDASGFVIAATPTAAAVDTDLSSSTGNYRIDIGSAFTLAATRTVNAVQFRGSASTLDLGTNRLETNGLFLSGGATNFKTVSAGVGGALTTPTGGGNLYITTGQVMTAGSEHRINAPITNADGGGVVNLVKSGAGILRLNGVNTFTGNLDINAGTLQIGTNATANGAKLGGATGIYAGNIFIAAGANLDFQTDASTTLSGVISGDGNLLKRYIGTLTLGNANTYTGKTTIGAITNTGSPTLVVSSFNSFNGGTPLLASSSLGAPTTLANATIQMGSSNSTPNPTLRYAGVLATGETTDRIINFTFNSSAIRTIDASGSGLLKFTTPFTGDNLNTGQLALTGTGSGEIAGLPFLFNNLTKSGNGSWTLAGTSGHIGTTTISAGVLNIRHANALGTVAGATSVAASSALEIQGGITVAEAITLAGTTGISSGGGIRNISGNNTLSGLITLTTGASRINSDAGTLTFDVASGDILSGVRAMTFGGAGNITMADPLWSSGAGSVTKDGAGTLTLSGNSGYTGTTTVTTGTLIVNGSLGNTVTNVGSAGTLGGIGTINGSTTIDGIHAPGSSPGIQTFSAGLSYGATATLNAEFVGDTLGVRGTNFDGVDVTGGNLDINLLATLALYAPSTDYTDILWDSVRDFTVIDHSGAGTSTGSFVLDTTNAGSFASQGSWSLANTSNDIILSWAPIPEPSSVALLGVLGSMMLLRRRR